MLFGIIPVKEAHDINIWANRPFVDNFFITLPEQWSMTLDQTEHKVIHLWTLLIKIFKRILDFVFVYFAQKNISSMIDQTFEKFCVLQRQIYCEQRKSLCCNFSGYQIETISENFGRYCSYSLFDWCTRGSATYIGQVL